MVAPAGVNEGVPQDPVTAGGARVEVAEGPAAATKPTEAAQTGTAQTGTAPTQAEAADTVQADTAKAEAKPAGVIPAEVVPAPAKPAEADMAVAAPATAEPAKAEPVADDPAKADLAEGAGVETAEGPAAGAKQTGTAPTLAEPTDTVQADPMQAEAKPAGVIPAQAVPAPAESPEGLAAVPGEKAAEAAPAEADVADTTPAKAEPAEADMPAAAPATAEPAAGDPAGTEPADSEPVEAEAGEPDWDAGEENRNISPLAVMGIIVGVIALVGVAVGVLDVITHGFRPKTVITYRPAAVFGLRPGECVNSGANALNVTVVSCTTRHDAEVFALFRLPDTGWPGASAVQQDAGKGCESRLAGYLNPALATADLTQEYVYPNKAAWQAGERTVVCEVSAASGPLTGSVRATR